MLVVQDMCASTVCLSGRVVLAVRPVFYFPHTILQCSFAQHTEVQLSFPNSQQITGGGLQDRGASSDERTFFLCSLVYFSYYISKISNAFELLQDCVVEPSFIMISLLFFLFYCFM